jgi:hypothetical protein
MSVYAKLEILDELYLLKFTKALQWLFPNLYTCTKTHLRFFTCPAKTGFLPSRD